MSKKLFRWIAFLEGLSYLLLLLAVPVKYLLNNDFYVKLLGMPHGILFVLYILFSISYSVKERWKIKTTIAVLIASIIPLGTFYVDKRYLQH